MEFELNIAQAPFADYLPFNFTLGSICGSTEEDVRLPNYHQGNNSCIMVALGKPVIVGSVYRNPTNANHLELSSRPRRGGKTQDVMDTLTSASHV